MLESEFPGEIQNEESLELLIADLESPSKKVVFAAIDFIIRNGEIEALEPMKHLLVSSDKLKVKAYAGLALKELKYELTKNEEQLLYESLIMLLENQNVDTRIFGAKIFAQCFPEKSSLQLLRLIKIANTYNDKRNKFEFNDNQYSELLGIIGKYGSQNTLRTMIDNYAANFCFRYRIDRSSKKPHDYSDTLKETENFKRTCEIFICVEELLKRMVERPDDESTEKINHFYTIGLIAEEATYIGDDSRDQEQVVNVYYSKFQEILKEKNWI